jgi:hypothetical protein
MNFDFKRLPEDVKLTIYFLILLIINWIVFDLIKYIWADDPFQKVILAPLAEEPFKLMLALVSVIYLYLLLRVLKKSKKEYKFKSSFSDFLSYTLIPFAGLIGIWFGFNEGPLNNIIFHFSATTLAAILVITIFKNIKDKDWKTSWKLIILYISMILPMLFHSIQNQYSNIGYANSHPEFNYLVVIGRFLKNNTFLANQGTFALFLFGLTYVALCIFIFNWFLKKKLSKFFLRKEE